MPVRMPIAVERRAQVLVGLPAHELLPVFVFAAIVGIHVAQEEVAYGVALSRGVQIEQLRSLEAHHTLLVLVIVYAGHALVIVISAVAKRLPAVVVLVGRVMPDAVAPRTRCRGHIALVGDPYIGVEPPAAAPVVFEVGVEHGGISAPSSTVAVPVSHQATPPSRCAPSRSRLPR